MFLNGSLSCTGAKTDLVPTREQEGGRFAAYPHHLSEKGSQVSGSAAPVGATWCQNAWSDGGDDLNHWHLGYVLATAAFRQRQCSRYLTAPWSPLPADLCKPPPPPKYLLQLLNPGILPPRPPLTTHTCYQYNQTLHPSTEKKWRVFKIMACFKVFAYLGQGRRYTNSVELNSSCEANPSELQDKSGTKLFY